MKKEAMAALVLGVLGILLAVNGIMSYGFYEEERQTTVEEGTEKSTIGYGLRGVHNSSRVVANRSVVSEEERYQDYDDLIGMEDTKTGKVASRMLVLLIVGVVITAVFLPMVYLAQAGFFDERFGKLGPYLPLLVAQIAAIILIIAPIWFSYAFVTSLDEDAAAMGQEPYQAEGGTTGFWIIVGGVLVQMAAVMALARTQLIYIPPPGVKEEAEFVR